MERYTWDPKDSEKRNAILTILLKADMGYKEIERALDMNGHKWSSTTLTKYLSGLEKDQCITKIFRGKREIYRALLGNPEVDALLERRVIVRGEIKLSGLSEKELLDVWIESVKFGLLNVFQCYMELGIGETEKRSRGTGATITIKKLLDGYILDMVETCSVYGEFLAKGLKEGRLDKTKVWAGISEIQEEIKGKWSTHTSDASEHYDPFFRQS